MKREAFIDENKTILDTNFYLYLLKCENEKQQLISFLEDKINLCNKDIKKLSENYCDYFSIIKENQVMLKVFQEVLDFVNKGGKDD